MRISQVMAPLAVLVVLAGSLARARGDELTDQAKRDVAAGLAAQSAGHYDEAIALCRSVEPSITQRVLTLDPASGNDVEMFTSDAMRSGRLVFSDVHRAVIRPITNTFSSPYPTESTALAAQDLAILFELFDAPSCTR